MSSPKYKTLRNILLLLLVLLLGAGGYLFFALKDTPDINYPTSRSDYYVAPEVTPQTRDDFSFLFFSQDEDPSGQALETVMDLLPFQSGKPDSEPLTEEELAAIEAAWEAYAPVRSTFERLVASPPYPMDYESYSTPIPKLNRIRALISVNVLRARMLRDAGKNPGPLINRTVEFIDQYYRSASALIDLMVVQVAYRSLLDNFSADFLASTPEVVESLEYWKSTWRDKLSVALKLEFFLLYNELDGSEVPPARVIFGDASNALGPFFMNFLFKPNETFNRYWDTVVRLGDAVKADDKKALESIEGEIIELYDKKDWRNLLGETLLSMTVINVSDIYERSIEFENALDPILEP